MIRVVLAVLVGAALLAVALPAVDAAGADHSDALARHEAGRLATTLDAFTRHADPVQNASASARRVLTLRLPRASWGDAGVARFRVVAGDPGAVCWRVRDGPTGRLYLPVAVVTRDPAPSAAPDALSLGAGRVRLRLRYVLHQGRPVVVVDRPGVQGG